MVIERDVLILTDDRDVDAIAAFEARLRWYPVGTA
jgi:hypothetical protein